MPFILQCIDLAKHIIDIVLHLDAYLNQWITVFGSGIYGILFLIIFSETGLVVAPFLPGDSLLFALGALTSTENAFLKWEYLAVLLPIAAILGDTLNYFVGRFLAHKVTNSKWVKKEYLNRTHEFYEKHGRKTIILSRFVPIIRTFAPFVAGVGEMPYLRFIGFSILGGLLWIESLLALGRYFGNFPAVKNNFHIVVIAIIIISSIPVLIEAWKIKKLSN